MKNWFAKSLPLLAVPLMVACGGGSSTGGSPGVLGTTTTPGSLEYPGSPPIATVALTADQFKANVASTTAGASLYGLAATVTGSATLPCGVEVHHMDFYTTGAAGENVLSSAALMLPVGTSALCTGKRPVVLYAHGTSVSQSYDLAALVDTSGSAPNPAKTEATLIATLYASNGYIVVAPNYAGYADSTLSYHPYLNASQQSSEMTDALTAARSALPLIGSTLQDSGALLVTGYSQGGHVAMATVRHLEALGKQVTASTPMSGPYAMGAFSDVIFSGTVDIGATLFLPLLTTSYQHAYGNLYNATTDIYAAQYATGIDTLLPSTLYDETTLFTQGKLPQTALFDSTPAAPYNTLLPPITSGAFGFGTSYLMLDSARAQYLADAEAQPDPVLQTPPTGILPPSTTSATGRSTMRIAAIRNDLRSQDGGATGFWFPHSPMLMCAGGLDPTVFSLNSQIISSYFTAARAQSPTVAQQVPAPGVLNIDPSAASTAKLSSSTGMDTQFATLEGAFNATNVADATANGTQQAQEDYHGTNVALFCTTASLLYFKAIAP